MYFSLRIKILGLLLILISVLAFVFNESATRLIFEKTEETFQERIIGLLDSLREYWEQECNLLLRSAVLYSESERIINYSIYGLYNLLLKEMHRLVIGSGFSDMKIALKDGTVLILEKNVTTKTSPLDSRDSRLALSNLSFRKHDKGLSMEATVPIHKMGEFVGQLKLTQVIDNIRLKKIARTLQADVTLAIAGDVIASSLTGEARRDMVIAIYKISEKHLRFFFSKFSR